MTKQALILHALYDKPESNWYPWLKTELEKKGYAAHVPDLPTLQNDIPELEPPLSFITTHFKIDEETIIIGHSIGCLIALHLAETIVYEKMILVAGWDYDDLYAPHRLYWKTPINHEAIKRNVKEIYCITSDNDPYVTAFQIEEMTKRLNGKYVLIPGAGHFIEKTGITKIPKILQYFNL